MPDDVLVQALLALMPVFEFFLFVALFLQTRLILL
jgi:hypothetical protein